MSGGLIAKETCEFLPRLESKAAEDCRTPRRFAMQLGARTSEGFGVRQSSAAFAFQGGRGALIMDSLQNVFRRSASGLPALLLARNVYDL